MRQPIGPDPELGERGVGAVVRAHAKDVAKDTAEDAMAGKDTVLWKGRC